MKGIDVNKAIISVIQENFFLLHFRELSVNRSLMRRKDKLFSYLIDEDDKNKVFHGRVRRRREEREKNLVLAVFKLDWQRNKGMIIFYPYSALVLSAKIHFEPEQVVAVTKRTKRS